MTLAQYEIGQDFSILLSNVKAETGVLAFQGKAGKFCLHLRSGVIQAVFVNGRPLRDPEQAQHLLALQLSDYPTGYQFEEALPEDLRKGLSISVRELLADAPEQCGCNERQATRQETAKPHAKSFFQRMFGQSVGDSALN